MRRPCRGHYVPQDEGAIGIDAALDAAAGISGLVTGPEGRIPLQDVFVSAYRWNGADWEWFFETVSNPDGRYALVPLPASSYPIAFTSLSGNYAYEVYDNAAHIGNGTNIEVQPGEYLQNLNIALVPTAPFPPRAPACPADLRRHKYSPAVPVDSR